MIIATAMQKGGVGKTTTTLALGNELASHGARPAGRPRPAGQLTEGLGYDPTQIEQSIYEVLLNPTTDPGFATLRTAFGVDLIPATLELAGAELAFAGRFGRELLLRTALVPLSSAYDYILIDSPPSLGLFTVNAMTAADTILVPLQAHVYALGAMGQIERTITMVQQLNPMLTIGGIVITMVDRRNNVNAMVEAQARDTYGDIVFRTTIPMSVKMIEAPAAGQPISVYAADERWRQAYRDLAEEVRQRWPVA